MGTVRGQERAIQSLMTALARGRLAHAYLFTGVDGIGKRGAALAVAKAFLCSAERGDRGAACGACPSCLAVDRLRHPDLLLAQDLQAIRWEEREALERRVFGDARPPGPDALTAAMAELAGEGLLLEPRSPDAARARIGFTLDPAQIHRAAEGGRRSGAVLDATQLSERLARKEEKGEITPEARRLAALLYYDELSRLPFRGSVGIHLVTRREPLTPERGSIREFLGRTSFHGGGKVVIVDDAHLLTEEAQNALLKTLEEPPAGSLLILVTSKPELLEPTVRSRTQEVRFNRLSPEILAEALREQGAGRELAAFLAGWADGSMGRALEAELEGLGHGRERVRALHGALLSGELARAMRVAAQISGAKKEKAESPDRLRRFRAMARNLELLLAWYRDLAVSAAAGPGAALLNVDLAAEVRRESARQPAATWRSLFALVALSLSRLGPSSDYRLHAEELVAGMALALGEGAAP